MKKSARRDRREPRTDLDFAHPGAIAPGCEDTPSDHLLRLVARGLPAIPQIDEPLKEKELIERGLEPWYEHLLKKAGAPAICMALEEERKRIREIYRLCFDHSRGRRR